MMRIKERYQNKSTTPKGKLVFEGEALGESSVPGPEIETEDMVAMLHLHSPHKQSEK